MADSRGLVKSAASSAFQDLIANRFGHQVVDQSIQHMIDAGMGYMAGIGLLSAGEALPAAAITTLRPQLWIRVPSGTTIKPFFVGINVEDSGATAAFEAALGFLRSDTGNGTSSAADFGPINLRSDITDTGRCTARQEATGDVSADPVVDVWRVWMSEDNAATPATVGNQNFEWKGINGLFYPTLVGPATWALYIGSSAAPIVTAQMAWVEGDSDLFKARI